MYRLPIALLILLVPTVGRADNGVFEVCKGESKHVVAGTGPLSIALVFPDDFPGRTTREVLFPQLIKERYRETRTQANRLLAHISAIWNTTRRLRRTTFTHDTRGWSPITFASSALSAPSAAAA